MKITFLVVLYNKSISDSTTLQTLRSLGFNRKNHTLVIWNNGPKNISLDFNESELKEWEGVDLVQTLENKPLSYIYNEIVEQYSGERYVFLDDDSILNDDYICDLIQENQNYQVMAPKIYVKNKIVSPLVNEVYREGPFNPGDEIRAITSGLVVTEELVKKYIDKFGNLFDSRFGFYGIDTTFFLRLQEMKLSNTVLVISKIEHSLSNFEEEEASVKQFRSDEMAYSYGLKMRFYTKNNKVEFCLFLIKALVKLVVGRLNYRRFLCVYKAYVSGKHWKC
ncbi:glycosyltransferase family 2 protein [Aeromonas salmonicida]|nr:glycosyltransferase [Aeromonas salmonicida]